MYFSIIAKHIFFGNNAKKEKNMKLVANLNFFPPYCIFNTQCNWGFSKNSVKVH